jgi:hypothetical protein
MIDRSLSTLLGLCDDQSAATASSMFCHDPSDTSTFAKVTMIRFAQMEEIFEVPTVKDFSPEETSAVWYHTKCKSIWQLRSKNTTTPYLH